MDANTKSPSHSSSGPVVLCACLAATAILISLSGVITAFLMLMDWLMAAHRRTLTLGEGLLWGAILLGPLAVGMALWALAWMVRRQHYAHVIQRRILGTLAQLGDLQAQAPAQPLPLAPPAAGAMDNNIAQHILDQLGELNNTLLMSDEQRAVKRKEKQGEVARYFTELFRRQLGDEDFMGAQATLAHLSSQVPDEALRKTLDAELAKARSSAQAGDLRRASQKVEDLMAVAAFKHAIKTAEQLLVRHPESREAAELLERIKRESAAHDLEQRKRLYQEVQKHAEAREWKLALEAAARLSEASPDSPEAAAVSIQVATMQENARLQEVRQLRDRIRLCIERHEFREAVELAEDVMQRFPQTQAATELRTQIDKLREKAREQEPRK